MTRILLIVASLISSGAAFASWHEEKASIMGTDVRVSLWHPNKDSGTSAISDVLSELRRVDALMSSYLESSELSLVNRQAAKGPVPVSGELLKLITQALAVSRRTEGAFDITYASVGYLYDYRNAVRPLQAAVDEHLGAVNYRHVNIDRQNSSISYSHPNVRIDLGGIAKGYAVDQAIIKLKKHNIEHAIISAGGDTRVLGKHEDRPWVVGIQDPRASDDVVAVIPLVDESISTSGDYERYFDENGVRYHHIIDPETGDSARALRSASILGPESTMADALSTSLFVLGLDKGVQLIDSIEGYEAILVDQNGRLHYSTGLQQYAEKPQLPETSMHAETKISKGSN